MDELLIIYKRPELPVLFALIEAICPWFVFLDYHLIYCKINHYLCASFSPALFSFFGKLTNATGYKSTQC